MAESRRGREGKGRGAEGDREGDRGRKGEGNKVRVGGGEGHGQCHKIHKINFV